MVTAPVPGTVLERDGAAYRVATPDGEVRAVLSGRTRRDAPRVVAGDRVELLPDRAHGLYAIVGVAERTSLLERRVPLGRGARPIVANIDTVFVVAAARDPAPMPQLLDRLLVVAEVNELPVAVIVNKIDLDPAKALIARCRRAGYRVFETSARSGAGLAALRDALAGRESVITGPSGVGKSSLLNALQPGLELRTSEISVKARRGRNTTVSARMLPFDGGYIVDTPGFNEVGLWGVEPRELASCFPDFRSYLGECRFQDCRHLGEPGCRVQAAVVGGEVAGDRLESYRMLLAETEAEPREWE